MLITVWSRENGRQEIEINLDEVKQFNIVNRPTYTTKGTFKMFHKIYLVHAGDQIYRVSDYVIQELKEALKGKYETSKYTQVEYKGLNERRATDWTYRVVK